MRSSNDRFNLLPWREKTLIKKFLIYVVWHLIIIILFFLVIIFANKWFDQWTLINQGQLMTLKNDLEQLKILESKQLKYDLRNTQNLRLQQTFNNNEKNKLIIHQLLADIATALPVRALISYFSVQGEAITLSGMTKTEDELVSLVMRLKHNRLIKTVHLKEMKKEANKNLVAFKIKAFLKGPLL